MVARCFTIWVVELWTENAVPYKRKLTETFQHCTLIWNIHVRSFPLQTWWFCPRLINIHNIQWYSSTYVMPSFDITIYNRLCHLVCERCSNLHMRLSSWTKPMSAPWTQTSFLEPGSPGNAFRVLRVAQSVLRWCLISWGLAFCSWQTAWF